MGVGWCRYVPLARSRLSGRRRVNAFEHGRSPAGCGTRDKERKDRAARGEAKPPIINLHGIAWIDRLDAAVVAELEVGT